MKRKLKQNRERVQWTTVERLNYVLSGWLPKRLSTYDLDLLHERVNDFAEWEVGCIESAYIDGYIDGLLNTTATSLDEKLEQYLERKYGCIPKQRTAVSVQPTNTKTEGSDCNAGNK